MKLLISLVGLRDPYGDGGSEGSILSAARQIAPDRVSLLASPNTLSHAGETADLLRRELGVDDVRVHPLSLEDVTDSHEIEQVLPAALRDALFRLPPDAEVHCATSSGTSQMRMVLLLLLQDAGRSVRYWETRAPEFVTPTRPRVREIRLAGLDRAVQGGRFEELWRLRNFPAVAALLREMVQSRPLAAGAARLGWMADLADAYARWDAVDWAGARDALTVLAEKIDARSSLAPLRPLLDEQVTLLPRLLAAQTSGLEDCWTMLDLYHNAARRLESAQYVDALVRWQRVLEGSLYAYARSLPGVAIALNGELTVDDSELRAKWLDFRAKPPYNETAPPARAEARVPDLLFLAQATGRLPAEFTRAIQGANEARNKTIATHGMRPVEPNMVRTALKQLRGMLEQLFASEAAVMPIDDYPLSSAPLDRLGNYLATVLREPA